MIGISMKVLLVATVTWHLTGAVIEQGLKQTTRFDVKPNAQHQHHSDKLRGTECVFSWTAVGGTNEGWQMTIKTRKDGSVVCTIERPEKPSYLYFMNFSASLMKKELASVEVFGKSGALSSQEYKISGDTVNHVESKFQNSITRIILTTKPKAHSEL